MTTGTLLLLGLGALVLAGGGKGKKKGGGSGAPAGGGSGGEGAEGGVAGKEPGEQPAPGVEPLTFDGIDGLHGSTVELVLGQPMQVRLQSDPLHIWSLSANVTSGDLELDVKSEDEVVEGTTNYIRVFTIMPVKGSGSALASFTHSPVNKPSQVDSFADVIIKVAG